MGLRNELTRESYQFLKKQSILKLEGLLKIQIFKNY